MSRWMLLCGAVLAGAMVAGCDRDTDRQEAYDPELDAPPSRTASEVDLSILEDQRRVSGDVAKARHAGPESTAPEAPGRGDAGGRPDTDGRTGSGDSATQGSDSVAPTPPTTPTTPTTPDATVAPEASEPPVAPAVLEGPDAPEVPEDSVD